MRCAPTATLVTLTETVHVAPEATLPPESETLVPPATAVTVPLPHVVDPPGEAAIVTPAGSASLSASAERSIEPAAVFATEIVSVEIPDGLIVAGANALLSVTSGGLTTESVAAAGAPFVAPCVLDTAPAGIVLRCNPSVALVTSTEIVHVAAAPTLPPESATAVPPAAAVTLPAPQVVDAFGVAAMVTFAGSVSESASPVSATDPAA